MTTSASDTEATTQYVIRLKENWKPTVERLVRGAVFRDAVEGADFDALLDEEVVVLDAHAIDADVTVGRGPMKVRCRSIGTPTPKGYCFFLTNVPRKTHGPHQVGELYRVRWEIEIDNKVDKAGARLDEITARRPVSAGRACTRSLQDADALRGFDRAAGEISSLRELEDLALRQRVPLWMPCRRALNADPVRDVHFRQDPHLGLILGRDDLQ